MLLALPVEQSYRYLPPAEGPAPKPGAWVEARAGGQAVFGAVWDGAIAPPPLPPGVAGVGGAGGRGPEAKDPKPKAKAGGARKLAAIERVLPAPPLPEGDREFLLWAARYTVTPPGSVLRAFAGAREALQAPGARERVSYDVPDLQAAARVARRARLGAAQEAARAGLASRIGGGFSATLLKGVTGSGKSEVYLEAVREALAKGEQALILLPEISLSAGWEGRVRERLGFSPLVWHSAVAPARRRAAWRAAASGDAPLVIGARSALFLPMPRLGLVVVDEEHDGSYKQEDGMIYSARDLAVARSRARGGGVRAGVGHAVAGDVGECEARALRLGGAARAPRGGGGCGCGRGGGRGCGGRVAARGLGGSAQRAPCLAGAGGCGGGGREREGGGEGCGLRFICAGA